MKVLIRFSAVVISISLAAGQVSAVPPGKTLEWAGAKDSPGRVVFDGKTHADKGLKCIDCHTKIFPMKKGVTRITMADLNAGKSCGACHNGDRSFKAGDPANCARCHRK